MIFLRRRANESDGDALSVCEMKLSFEMELNLVLLRHWSLIDSICHSPLTACNFRVWTMKGRKKLHEFLADMGCAT